MMDEWQACRGGDCFERYLVLAEKAQPSILDAHRCDEKA
jgi:hypothetical protein